MKFRLIWLVLACLFGGVCGSHVLAEDEGDAIRQGPRIIRAADVGVGLMAHDWQANSIDGKLVRLSDYQSRVVVVAMTGTGCPLCLKYAPTLAAIENRYRDRDVQFVYLNPNRSEKRDRIIDAIAQHGFIGAYLQDEEMQVSSALDAKTTTEVFVIDQAKTLVYRGAVDDQYGFGYTLTQPRVHYLTDAIDAVLSGRSPRVPATSAPGCELFYGKSSQPVAPQLSPKSNVTYHREIARIIQSHCIECHRDEGIGPIPLETYQQVRDYAGMIGDVVKRGVMPPWFAKDAVAKDAVAEEGAAEDGAAEDGAAEAQVADRETELTRPSSSVSAEHERTPHWANERLLSQKEKTLLQQWIESGAPEGELADAPLANRFPEGWLIGKPDAVFEFSKPVPIKATGTMPYRNVVVETNLDEGKWVRAIEVRPGNRSVVHHVIVSLQAENRDERSGYWGIYVPGNSTLDYDEGYAKWLPKGARLRFQMHYTPNGTATEDSTQIGLIFAKQPPEHEVKVHGVSNVRFRIPAGDANHPVSAVLDIPQDVRVLGFLPHMHLRGKAARYELIRNDTTENLLEIPRYDFNWQLRYQLSKPRLMHPGDVIRYTSWYDNSQENPANPDPNRNVRWGQQTEDEMHLGYVEYVVVGETPSPDGPEHTEDRASSVAGKLKKALLFRRLDVNQDGFITRDEVRKRMPGDRPAATTIFDRLDRNQDSKINREELSRL